MLASPIRVFLAVFLVVAVGAAGCGDATTEPVAEPDEAAPATAGTEPDTAATADDATKPDDAGSDDAGSDGSVAGDSAALSSKPEVSEDLLGSYDTLVTTDLIVGSGTEAKTGDNISMQYVGVLGSDGTEFDASWNRGAPFDFTLGAGQVISGWDEGIVGMKVGGRRVLQIPSDMAYGATARGDVIGANADLLFIVDLIEVAPPPPTPVPPPPAPPIDDEFLGAFDELAITDLIEGEGRAAAEGDIIAVQYVGVLAADGTEFDSSWSRGAIPFRVIAGRGGVIDGWNQGLLGMKVGGERLLQIPAQLAYGDAGAGGAIGPDTDLVFRIHLEELVEAPLSHTLSFTAPSPADVETTTLVPGDGPEATSASTVQMHLAVYYHDESLLVESTYTDDRAQSLDLAADDFVPGLVDALVGIQAGELRQVIVPVPVAFPEGVPANAGLSDDDGLVFVVEALSVN